MKKYQLLKAHGEPDFNLIPVIDINERYLETPDDIGANAQICYGEDSFFVHLWTAERDIRAEENGPIGYPCFDSCLEFFICPMEDDSRYLNFEININGCVFCGFGSGDADLIRLVPEGRRFEDILSYRINRTEVGWEIFYKVPYDLIRQFFPEFKVYTGKQMRANCCKCADFSTPPHYLSWSKISEERFSFHRPECFGVMEFM